jgi:hypothetical protein
MPGGDVNERAALTVLQAASNGLNTLRELLHSASEACPRRDIELRIASCRIRALDKRVLAAIDRLSDIRRTVEEGATPNLTTIAKAQSELTESLNEATAALRTGHTALKILPDVLGSTKPRTYLLLLQSPSEARGGGGLIGMVGLLRVSDAGLELTRLAAVRSFGPPPKVRGPKWYHDAYDRFQALSDWRQANPSPNFPVTARLLAKMYELQFQARLDGVVALDPLLFTAITRITGPFSIRGWSVAIDEFNARRILLAKLYRHFDGQHKRQNRYLERLAVAAMNRLENMSPAELVSVMSWGVPRQHLRFFMREEDEQRVLRQVGAAGFTGGPANAQLIYDNEWSGSKISFFIKRRITILANVMLSGDVRVKTSITLKNEVGARAVNSNAVRPVDRNLAPGTSDMTLHLLLPTRAQAIQVVGGSHSVASHRAIEKRHPMMWIPVTLARGETRTVFVSYTIPQRPQPERGLDFTLTLHPQTAVRPDRFTVLVNPPHGYRIPRAEEHSISEVWAGRLKASKEIAVEMVPGTQNQ